MESSVMCQGHMVDMPWIPQHMSSPSKYEARKNTAALSLVLQTLETFFVTTGYEPSLLKRVL